jgi:hypothetical protein
MADIKDLVWAEKIEGRDKPVYHNVGIVRIADDMRVSVKINVIPAGNWNGWLQVLQVYDRKPKDQAPAEESTRDEWS